MNTNDVSLLVYLKHKHEKGTTNMTIADAKDSEVNFPSKNINNPDFLFPFLQFL